MMIPGTARTHDRFANGSVPATLFSHVLIITGLILASCSSPTAALPTPSLEPTNTRVPPSSTPKPTSTPQPTPSPTPTIIPTPLGGALGGSLLADAYEVVSGYIGQKIYLQPNPTSSPVPLAEGLLGVWMASISPDGSKALFVSGDSPMRWAHGEYDPTNYSVFSLQLSSGLMTNLSDMDNWSLNPDWSPDSRQVVYANTHGDIGNIYRVNADGTESKKLSKDGISFLPRWAPHGDQIAFIRRYTDEKANVFLMDTDGNHVRQLTKGNFYDGYMDDLNWSPDGKFLAVVRAEYDPVYPIMPRKVTLLIANVETGEITEVDQVSAKLPAWSPDGSRLAYVQGDYSLPSSSTLVWVDINNLSKKNALHSSNRQIYHLEWSRDGKLLNYSEADAESFYLGMVYIVDAASGAVVYTQKNYDLTYWIAAPVSLIGPPAECPAGASTLKPGDRAILAPGRPSNPLRAMPGRTSYQMAEIQQGTVLHLIERACAPERIYWLVSMPDGLKGWTAEGDGKEAWLVPYTGQSLAASPTPTTQGTSTCTNDSKFVADVTIPDNTAVNAGTKFTKTWRIKNSGTCTWHEDYTWRLINGDAMGAPASISIGTGRTVAPGEEVDISVEFTAPATSGNYKNQWQLYSTTGEPFGTKPFMLIKVP